MLSSIKITDQLSFYIHSLGNNGLRQFMICIDDIVQAKKIIQCPTNHDKSLTQLKCNCGTDLLPKYLAASKYENKMCDMVREFILNLFHLMDGCMTRWKAADDMGTRPNWNIR